MEDKSIAVDEMIIKIKDEDVIIDADDYDKVSKFIWRKDKDGAFFRKSKSMGRISEMKLRYYILGVSSGHGIKIKHINKNKNDYRKSNLIIILSSGECINDFYLRKDEYKNMLKNYEEPKYKRGRKLSKKKIDRLRLEMEKQIEKVIRGLEQLKKENGVKERKIIRLTKKIEKYVNRLELWSKYDIIIVEIEGDVYKVKFRGRDKVMIIDANIYNEMIKYDWTMSLDGYVTSSDRQMKLHRLVLISNGIKQSDKSMVVDHKNGNILDNRLENLRWCNTKENAKNRKKNKGRDCKGVRYIRGSYYVNISCNNKKHYLGAYKDKELAMFVYDINAKKLHGEFARFNMPNLSQEKYDILMDKYNKIKRKEHKKKHKDFNSNEVEDIMEKYNCGMGVVKLSDIYNTSTNCIVDIIKNSDVVRRTRTKRKNFTADEIKIIIDYYKSNQPITLEQMAEKFDSALITMHFLFKRNNVNWKDYDPHHKDIKHNYFDVIDDEDKAYFLGFLFADGSNSKDGVLVTIGLQERDKDILERFRKLIGAGPLKHHHRKKDIRNDYICQDIDTLYIPSKQISKRLKDLGMVPNKTFVLEYPKELDKKWERHFVRGFTDGNGCICKYDLTIIGSEYIIKRMAKIISDNCDVKYRITTHKNGKNKIINIESKQAVVKVLSWMYDDCNLYLKRKYNKYLDIKDVSLKGRMKRTIRATSEYYGVSKVKDRNGWSIDLKANDKRLYLGYYMDEKQAAYGYNVGLELLGLDKEFNKVELEYEDKVIVKDKVEGYLIKKGLIDYTVISVMEIS